MVEESHPFFQKKKKMQYERGQFGIFGFGSYEIGILGYGSPKIGIFGIPGPPLHTPTITTLQASAVEPMWYLC